MNDRDVVIVDALRTAVGRKNGSLSGMHPVVLLAKALEELVRRTDVPKDDIEDVISGCVDQIGEQAANVGSTLRFFSYTKSSSSGVAPTPSA